MQFNQCEVVRFMEKLTPQNLAALGAWVNARTAQIRFYGKLFLLVGVLLTGCSQAPVSPSSEFSSQEFTRYHHQMAQQLINSGSYFQALQHVEILTIVEPYNSTYQKNIEALRRRIKNRKQQLLEQSEASRDKGDNRKAYLSLLQALSLDPEDVSLLPQLQQHYANTLDGEQKRKQSNDLTISKPVANKTASVSMPNTSAPADPLKQLRELFKQENYRELISEVEASTGMVKAGTEVKGWLTRAHLALAREQYRENHLDNAAQHVTNAQSYQPIPKPLTEELNSIRRDIARALLVEGKALLRSDLEKAVNILEKAKELDDQDRSIQVALERAYRLKDNLGRIKGKTL